jgi:hypothetical protein
MSTFKKMSIHPGKTRYQYGNKKRKKTHELVDIIDNQGNTHVRWGRYIRPGVLSVRWHTKDYQLSSMNNFQINNDGPYKDD